MSGFFYYFAYDSDMHPAQLACRAPTFEAVGIGRLPGHALRFHKRLGEKGGNAGSGNAFLTGSDQDAVYGAVYRIATEDRAVVREPGGDAAGYDVINSTVEMESGSVLACLRIALPDWIDDTLIPYDWYVALVSSGARIHGLPAAYQRMLRRVKCVADPDRERAESFFRIARKGDVIIPFPRKPSDH